MTRDGELLRRYTEERSEDAFAELVGRHLDLVYSAALRQLNGDAHLAQDVAQSVFSDLARKAATLSSRSDLAGWLYTSTHFAAAKAARSEQRRRAREQEARIMQTLPPTAEPDWEQLRLVLDQAMHDLNEADREAVVLRYFQNHPHAVIGEKLGLSENTARMRVERAVDKLREHLSRRGVTTAASTLTLLISVNAVLSAPAGLAAALTSASLAAGATASASTFGILTLMTSAKTTALIGTAAILLLAGGAAVSFYKANHTPPAPVTTPAENTKPDSARTTPRADQLNAPRPAAAAIDPDPSLAEALARVQAVLDNPRPGPRGHPNPQMIAAIEGLGNRRSAALPMLRAALKSKTPRVAQQAAEGLALLGSEAKEAVPDLLETLRTTGANALDTLCFLGAIKDIGAEPGILPDLAKIVKERSSLISISIRIPEMFPENAEEVDRVFRPYLRDADLGVRRQAAYVLSAMLGGNAGPDVIAVGIEALKATANDLTAGAEQSRDIEDLLRPARNRNLVSHALNTVYTAGRDPNDPSRRVTTASLGPGAADATAALITILKHNPEATQRGSALLLLDGLNPDLEQEPEVAALLKDFRQTAEFSRKTSESGSTLPELIDGLRLHPDAIEQTAKELGRLGPAAQSALPALREALNALDPKPRTRSSPPSPISNPLNKREAIVNAMQKIAPDQPKPLFTISDASVLIDLFDAPGIEDDRRQRIAEAAGPVCREMNDQGLELTPTQMRRLLDALKAVDQPMYDTIVARVKKIDPNFVMSSQ